MNYDAWFKSLNQNGRITYFLGQEGTISKEVWNYQQEKIDELRSLFESVVSDDMKTIERLESVIDENSVDIKKLQGRIDDLNELNRLKTIALQQSLNRTSIHVHEKIIALEKKLKGNKDEN